MVNNQRDNDGGIGRLRRRLYERGVDLPPLRRSRLSAPPADARGGWRFGRTVPGRTTSGLFFKIVLAASFLFFVLAAALAFVVFYRGGNVISSGNVLLQVVGPNQARAGEEVAFLINVANRNNAALESVDLILEYPPGVKSVGGDGSGWVGRQRFPLGNLAAGEEVRRSVKVSFWGEEGSQAETKIIVEYRLAGSNAIFDKRTTQLLNLSSSPLLLALKVPDEVDSGRELSFQIEIAANAAERLGEMALLATYPPGFQFLRALPNPERDNNFWRLGRLAPGESRRVQITGVWAGQDEEQKVLRAIAGPADPNDPAGSIGVVYGSEFKTVAVRRPFVSLAAALNGDQAQEIIVDSRQPIRLEVDWFNNTSDEILNAEVSVVFGGEVLEATSVSPLRGFYHSLNRTILWNKTTNPLLSSTPPSGEGKTSANFSTVSLIGNQFIKNPAIDLLVKFRGERRRAGGGQNELVQSEIQKKIRLNSVIQLAGKALYRDGPFINRGSLPPKVGEETTYTIALSVLNSSNDLSSGKVKFILPAYVSWLGVWEPTNEMLVFNPALGGGGEGVWEIGAVRAGAGLSVASREVAFQIGFTPSLSQVDSTPTLVRELILFATDIFTQKELTASLRRPLDTWLTSDSGFQFGQDKVAQ